MPLTASPTTWSAKLYRRLQVSLRRKPVRRRAIRYGLLASNVVVLAVITGFVLHKPAEGPATAAALLNQAVPTAAPNPLDQVSSTDIALTVARLSSLPETTAITNQAQSQEAEIAIAASSNNVVSKPQVVTTALKSGDDIQAYTTKEGETVSSLAARFGVTSDSIRWSNNLSGDSLAAGTTLKIPPINGIVYTVQAGDTPDSLAAKFQANKDKIIAYNDGEINGLSVGQEIIIPDAIKVTSATARSISAGTASFPWGGGSPVYGSFNGYDYGYCTWYVANQIPVPNNWGNANTWAYYAARSGWNVSSTPSTGSIAQTPAGGWGHVAIVEGVSEDGTMIRYRDMNGIAGFAREGHSGWVPASKFPRYISR